MKKWSENCCTGKKLSMAVAVLLLVAAFALVGAHEGGTDACHR